MREIKLKKNMDKNQVNNLIQTWTKLEDNIYLGDKHLHNWKCKCGENIVSSWGNMRFRNKIECEKCKYLNKEQRYKSEIEKTGEYEYVRSFRKGDILPNGRYVKFSPFIQIRHKYCNNLHEINASTFINNSKGSSCPHCCGSYENSFAYHIEVELGEPLEKYWDFEKNTANPYHIWKSGTEKVWVKCQEKDYHGAYETLCSVFTRGVRCSYCGNHKVHPKDSFAQYHIDNTDPNFLEKYWDYDKNTVDPWKISYSSNRNKVWIKCQNSELNKLNMIKKNIYHSSYEIKCNKFSQNQRCPLCNTFASKKVHPYDSFGYHNFDKVMSWHPDNEISPFRVARNSNKKYKFICETCEEVWSSYISNINKGRWCPKCASSRGEKRIIKFLNIDNINYIHDKPYFQDLLSDKGNPLRPDFILPDHKIWIEYDGEFHYKDFYKDGSYETLKIHDKLKNNYAKKHGWKMIRIPYWDFDNIENILNIV